ALTWTKCAPHSGSRAGSCRCRHRRSRTCIWPRDIRAVVRERFWEHFPLHELNSAEWEALCDGCGRCCLVKLEDEDTGELHYTELACRMLDTDTCRCLDYAARQTHVPDCVQV